MRIGYLSGKMEVVENPNKGGKAVMAKHLIRKDELVAIWGGFIVNYQQLRELTEEEQGHTVQVSDDFFLAPLSMDEPADFINHSCDPNCGVQGQIILVAMRDIQLGEEVTFDYAMTDSSPFDEFDCGCASPHCRGKVTRDDWKLPDLWQRYEGYFSTYLGNRISKFRRSID